jgi:hypothetical protein
VRIKEFLELSWILFEETIAKILNWDPWRLHTPIYAGAMQLNCVD